MNDELIDSFKLITDRDERELANDYDEILEDDLLDIDEERYDIKNIKRI